MERETTFSQQEDMNLLLTHSTTQKSILENLLKLRKAIREADTTKIPQDEIYYRRLHSKIMSEVLKANAEKMEDKNRKKARPEKSVNQRV
jgi:hypothetical protein